MEVARAPRISTAALFYFGKSASWIRQAEAAGLIPPIPRDHHGFRRFTDPYVAEARGILSALAEVDPR